MRRAALISRARSVALKLLPTGTVTPRQLTHLAQMAQREATLHRALTHHRLIRAYQVLTIDDRANPELDGAVALVMERAECSLADVLRRNAGRSVPDAAKLVEQICEGLAYMHGAPPS
jgi:serine/threonine protein kinase